MAESTKATQPVISDRDVSPTLCLRLLKEIKTEDVRSICLKVKDRGAPATAIHVRNGFKQICAFAILGGEKLKNIAEEDLPASSTTFKPRDHSLAPKQIRVFPKMLEHVPTLPAIRPGIPHETVQQLRGASTAQVAGARVSVVHGVGGMFSAAATATLPTEPRWQMTRSHPPSHSDSRRGASNETGRR